MGWPEQKRSWNWRQAPKRQSGDQDVRDEAAESLRTRCLRTGHPPVGCPMDATCPASLPADRLVA